MLSIYAVTHCRLNQLPIPTAVNPYSRVLTALLTTLLLSRLQHNLVEPLQVLRDMAFAGLIFKALGLVIIMLLSQYILEYLRSPLKKIPGPFLAKFSNIWRFLNHYSQTHIETQKKLHEKYGDFVRLGPTTVSIADPSLIKTIYNTRGTFAKVSTPNITCVRIGFLMYDTERILLRQRRSFKRPCSPKHLQHPKQRVQCSQQKACAEAVQFAERYAVGVAHG